METEHKTAQRAIQTMERWVDRIVEDLFKILKYF